MLFFFFFFFKCESWIHLSTHTLIHLPIYQLLNWTVNQPTSHSVDQANHHSLEQSTNQPLYQPGNQPTSHWTDKSSHSTDRPINQPNHFSPKWSISPGNSTSQSTKPLLTQATNLTNEFDQSRLNCVSVTDIFVSQRCDRIITINVFYHWYVCLLLFCVFRSVFSN